MRGVVFGAALSVPLWWLVWYTATVGPALAFWLAVAALSLRPGRSR